MCKKQSTGALAGILRLTSRTVQPEDGDAAGWERVAVIRLEIIAKLAKMAIRHESILLNALRDVGNELGELCRDRDTYEMACDMIDESAAIVSAAMVDQD